MGLQSARKLITVPRDSETPDYILIIALLSIACALSLWPFFRTPGRHSLISLTIALAMIVIHDLFNLDETTQDCMAAVDMYFHGLVSFGLQIKACFVNRA